MVVTGAGLNCPIRDHLIVVLGIEMNIENTLYGSTLVSGVRRDITTGVLVVGGGVRRQQTIYRMNPLWCHQQLCTYTICTLLRVMELAISISLNICFISARLVMRMLKWNSGLLRAGKMLQGLIWKRVSFVWGKNNSILDGEDCLLSLR